MLLGAPAPRCLPWKKADGGEASGCPALGLGMGCAPGRVPLQGGGPGQLGWSREAPYAVGRSPPLLEDNRAEDAMRQHAVPQGTGGFCWAGAGGRPALGSRKPSPVPNWDPRKAG